MEFEKTVSCVSCIPSEATSCSLLPRRTWRVVSVLRTALWVPARTCKTSQAAEASCPVVPGDALHVPVVAPTLGFPTCARLPATFGAWLCLHDCRCALACTRVTPQVLVNVDW